jgi:hypothetical protein
MSEFRDQLDAEARRVRAGPDALEQLKVRARRRRIRRQVGSGVAALAVAGAGFAVAVGAFRGPGQTGPAVGPSASPSPTPVTVVVAAPTSLRMEASDLAERLKEDGYLVELKLLAREEVPSHSLVAYGPDTDEAAREIIRRFLPGLSLTGQGYLGRPIEIRLAPSDYPAVTVQVRVLDAGAGRAATVAAAEMLQDAGYDVVEIGGESELLIKAGAIVACAPNHDDEGLRILEEFFPDADFRGEIPSEDHDVTVYIGPDFELPGAGAGN